MTHFCLLSAAVLAGTVVAVGVDVVGAAGAVGTDGVVVVLVMVQALLASLVLCPFAVLCRCPSKECVSQRC